MRARDFLTKAEKDRVTAAIVLAETATSGEIRIHIETKCSEDPRERALRSFNTLKMTETAARNGVLIYVASDSRKFAVIGDKGINDVVPEDFWADVCVLLHDAFAEEKYADGLENAVRLIGQKLQDYFPYQEDDVNELPDEISIADDDDGPIEFGDDADD